MVSAQVTDREGAKVWIEQVELLRQKNCGTLVFLCQVSEKRFGLKAEVSDGRLVIRVSDEHDQNGAEKIVSRRRRRDQRGRPAVQAL